MGRDRGKGSGRGRGNSLKGVGGNKLLLLRLSEVLGVTGLLLSCCRNQCRSFAAREVLNAFPLSPQTFPCLDAAPPPDLALPCAALFPDPSPALCCMTPELCLPHAVRSPELQRQPRSAQGGGCNC